MIFNPQSRKEAALRTNVILPYLGGACHGETINVRDVFERLV